MPKPVSSWVQREAAKHTRPESIRRRIATAEKHIETLAVVTGSREAQMALKAHYELIQVLTESLADFDKRPSRTANKTR